MENVTIKNSSAEFGGAICHLGGFLTINNSIFQENTATYDGGGIYLDNSKHTHINNNIIANNTKNRLYLYDCDLNINNTRFEGNGEAIHGVFLRYYMDNVP